MDSVEILKAERDKLLRMVKVLNQSIAALSGEMSGGSKRANAATGTKRKKMSAATKAKIAKAAKARWAKVKGKKAE
jgi:hypothetical protein